MYAQLYDLFLAPPMLSVVYHALALAEPFFGDHARSPLRSCCLLAGRAAAGVPLQRAGPSPRNLSMLRGHVWPPAQPERRHSAQASASGRRASSATLTLAPFSPTSSADAHR